MIRQCFVGLVMGCVVSIVSLAASGDAVDGQGKLVRVRGSNAMARITDTWGAAFSSANPGKHVAVMGGGTAAGFEALFDKAADLTMASRKVLVKERQAAALNDCNLKEVEVCSGAVAVITHPSNPVRELTLDQLGKILKGEISNWKDVGGPDEAIAVYVGQPISGTAEYLRAEVMGNEYFSSDVRVRDYYHHIIRDLSRKQPAGLGYAPLLDATAAQEKHLVRIMGVKKDQAAPAVHPSFATIADKSYPLILPLYFYWNADAASPLIGKFVDFCRNQCEIGR